MGEITNWVPAHFFEKSRKDDFGPFNLFPLRVRVGATGVKQRKQHHSLCKTRYETMREFQTQLLHYFFKSDNKSHHHHRTLKDFWTRFQSHMCVLSEKFRRMWCLWDSGWLTRNRISKQCRMHRQHRSEFNCKPVKQKWYSSCDLVCAEILYAWAWQGVFQGILTVQEKNKGHASEVIIITRVDQATQSLPFNANTRKLKYKTCAH